MTPTTAHAVTAVDALNRYIADAYQSMITLNAARREASSEYQERWRKLRDLKDALHIARGRAAEELFDVSTVISADLIKLVVNPLHGL